MSSIPEDDAVRAVYDSVLSRAHMHYAAEHGPGFAIWAFREIIGFGEREFRYAALDAILAAMEDRS